MASVSADEKVSCRCVEPGRKPTNIPAWKFDCVRKAILAALRTAPNGLPFKELPGAVKQNLSGSELDQLGSVAWHTTTVKLELEVRGEIKRVAKASPQLLVLA